MLKNLLLQKQRKLLFLSLICVMCGAHVLLYFVPEVPIHSFSLYDVTCFDMISCSKNVSTQLVPYKKI